MAGRTGTARMPVIIASLAALVAIGSGAPIASGAAAGPPVITRATAGPRPVPAPTIGTVATLDLPAGAWLLTAKALLVGVGGALGQHLGVTCSLNLGGRTDRLDAAPTFQGSDGPGWPFS
jgi:hypothetical protein